MSNIDSLHAAWIDSRDGVSADAECAAAAELIEAMKSNACDDRVEARRIIQAARLGYFTEAEAVIDLAKLLDVDAKCAMGECGCNA